MSLEPIPGRQMNQHVMAGMSRIVAASVLPHGGAVLTLGLLFHVDVVVALDGLTQSARL